MSRAEQQTSKPPWRGFFAAAGITFALEAGWWCAWALVPPTAMTASWIPFAAIGLLVAVVGSIRTGGLRQCVWITLGAVAGTAAVLGSLFALFLIDGS